MRSLTEQESLEFARIEYLLNPDVLVEKEVSIVGVGSGGAPVCDHLSMNGVRKWNLFDPDTLDAVNLVKHPRRRAALGRLKVEAQRDWILDRNPSAEVAIFDENVLDSAYFKEKAEQSDLVLICPDTQSVREFVSDICVAVATPFVGASVFRTGIGGEIYRFVPGEFGCYRCLELFALRNNLNIRDEDLGLTEDEEHRIYGLGEHQYRASGLSLDIQMIALIQARMALDLLLKGSNSSVAPVQANWIIYGNRPSPGIFRRHFEVRRFVLRPQTGCSCQVPDSLRNLTDRSLPV